MNGCVYVSRDGLARLESELRRMESEFRELCDERTTACELAGDGWHDNPYLNLLQQREAAKSRELFEQRDLVSRARVVEYARPERPVVRVELGSIVELLVTDNQTGRDESMVWEIVGYGEGDRSVRRIAYTSPMAAAVLGREVGDMAEATLPQRQVSVEVVALHPTWSAARRSTQPEQGAM